MKHIWQMAVCFCVLPLFITGCDSVQYSGGQGVSADGQKAHVEYVTVKRVADGDTVWVYADNPDHIVKVRLLDIDAPERCQDWGKESKLALRQKVQGRTVEIERDGVDKYQRVLATLYLDGENINAWLVAQGHAWAGRWHGDVQNYDQEEWEAQRAQRGLWAADVEPMYPREFRRSGVVCD